MYPDPVEAAILAQNEGADGITHLREDRRHIRDEDIDGLIAALNIPLNFEMAATEEMQKIALKTNPMLYASYQKRERSGLQRVV